MTSLLLTSIGHLTTNDGDPIGDAAILIEDSRVAFVGAQSDAPYLGDAVHLDCAGRAVIPGFFDAHTHLVFGGDRSAEFRRKMAGEDYREILASGGGILSTVNATRRVSNRELERVATGRLRTMIGNGTTGIEVKSGYGLDLATERKQLEVAAGLAESTGIPVRTTFLGAHAVPTEFAADRDQYVALVIDEMLPAFAGLADDCDVFVERGTFTVDEGRVILAAAKALGMGLRVHAEQLSHFGGARLAAELGALSADHLDHVTGDDAEALAEAGVAAVLTPGASFMMRESQAPGAMLWEAGCVVAIATDCNPGTSYFESMPLMVALAVVQMGLTVEQALWAATRGGALALGWPDRGSISPGGWADLNILETTSPDHLAYRPGASLIHSTIASGRILRSNFQLPEERIG